MKSSTKKILVIAAFMIPIGLIIGSLGLILSGGKAGIRYIKNQGFVKAWAGEGKSFTEEIKGNIKKINIDVEESNIYIVESDKFSVEYYINGEHDVKVKTEGNKLDISSYSKRSITFNLFNFEHYDEYFIKIYVPAGTVFDEIKIHTNLGAVELSDIKAKDVSAKINLGHCQIEDSSFETFKLKSGLGALEILDTNIGKSAEIVLNSGAASIYKSNISDTKIELNLGALEISDSICKNLKASSNSGAMELSGKFPGECEAKTNLGAIEVEIEDRRENYIIEGSVGLGSFDVEGMNPASAPNSMKLVSNTGAVEVSFER